ncbi:hypothetical protein EJB05_47050, partial [Eragrostis curvula]
MYRPGRHCSAPRPDRRRHAVSELCGLGLRTSECVHSSSGGVRLRPQEVKSDVGAVAADDGQCSEVGAAALRAGGHAVDATVATAICPMSSGFGGGAFIVVREAASGEAVAFTLQCTGERGHAGMYATWSFINY